MFIGKGFTADGNRDTFGQYRGMRQGATEILRRAIGRGKFFSGYRSKGDRREIDIAGARSSRCQYLTRIPQFDIIRDVGIERIVNAYSPQVAAQIGSSGRSLKATGIEHIGLNHR